MTANELDQLSKLGNEINQINTEIIRLTTLAESITSGEMDDMPHGSGTSDKVGNNASMIADYKAELIKDKNKYWKEVNRLLEFIRAIEDSEMRQIISLRYRNNFTFQQIAFAIGHYDESYPRRKHNAFLKTADSAD